MHVMKNVIENKRIELKCDKFHSMTKKKDEESNSSNENIQFHRFNLKYDFC